MEKSWNCDFEFLWELCHEETYIIKPFKMLTLETKYSLNWPKIYEPIYYTPLKHGQKSAAHNFFKFYHCL